MTASRVLARRYALALAELAFEQGRLDEAESGLTRVLEGLAARADLRWLWYHAHLAPTRRVEHLREALGDAVPDLVYRFLRVVAEKGRQGLLVAIGEQFGIEADRLRGVVRVDVEVAAPLDPADRKTLEQMIRDRLGAREVRLSIRQDPDLIAGIAIRAGDVRIDGTLSRQLDRLHQRLRRVGPKDSAVSVDGRAG